MKIILCPTDFNTNSLNAIKYACNLAKAFKSKVVLLHVLEIPVLYSDVPFADVQSAYSFLQQDADKELLKTIKSLHVSFPEIKFQGLVKQGAAAEVINQTAEEQKADLVVMSSLSKNEYERIIFGSVTSRVLKTANTQILVVPPRYKFTTVKNIAYATSGSPENLSEALKLVTLAKGLKSTLTLLHVDDGNKEIDLKAAQIALGYKQTKSAVISHIDIKEGISQYLKTSKPDIICMFKHHRSFFDGLIQGSITQKVIKNIRIPLLVLPETNS